MFGIHPANVQWPDKYLLEKSKLVTAWWGARAVYHNDFTFDMIWDRQQITGGSIDNQNELSEWINKDGLKQLRKMVKEAKLYPNDDFVERLSIGGFYLVANPKKSYGHIYFGAWKEPELPRETLERINREGYLI